MTLDQAKQINTAHCSKHKRELEVIYYCPDCDNEESNQVQAGVKPANGGNEVTDFGVDYDNAITAGEDGWQCGNCGKWNRKEYYICKHCVEYDE